MPEYVICEGIPVKPVTLITVLANIKIGGLLSKKMQKTIQIMHLYFYYFSVSVLFVTDI